jgi:hypothetical protein
MHNGSGREAKYVSSMRELSQVAHLLCPLLKTCGHFLRNQLTFLLSGFQALHDTRNQLKQQLTDKADMSQQLNSQIQKVRTFQRNLLIKGG